MQKIAYLRQRSGAKALLALKCFATWSLFDFMRQYMDGTTSSSLYEVKLGQQNSVVKLMLTAWRTAMMKLKTSLPMLIKLFSTLLAS